jgi:hypothetical protein
MTSLFQDEFVCGGTAATNKFIPGFTNARLGLPKIAVKVPHCREKV